MDSFKCDISKLINKYSNGMLMRGLELENNLLRRLRITEVGGIISVRWKELFEKRIEKRKNR